MHLGWIREGNFPFLCLHAAHKKISSCRYVLLLKKLWIIYCVLFPYYLCFSWTNFPLNNDQTWSVTAYRIWPLQEPRLEEMLGTCCSGSWWLNNYFNRLFCNADIKRRLMRETRCTRHSTDRRRSCLDIRKRNILCGEKVSFTILNMRDASA